MRNLFAKSTRRQNAEFAINLKQRRVWYSPEGEPPAAPPAPLPAPATPPPSAEDDIQKRMDALAGNVRKEATIAARKALLKELGLDPDDPKAVETVKGKLTEAEKAADAKKSAEEKALEKIAALEQERDAAKADREKIIVERQLEQRDNTIKAALAELHCKNPQKVLVLVSADHKADVEAVLKDDGTVDAAKLKTLVDLGKKENPEFFTGGSPGSPSNSGGRAAPVDGDAQKRASATNQSYIRG